MEDVYIARMGALSAKRNMENKIQALCTAASLDTVISPGDLTAIKIDFGERGCDVLVNALYLACIVRSIKEVGAKPFLTDTNTLSLGGRRNAIDHVETALSHGFCYPVTECPILIADGLKGTNLKEVEVYGKHFSTVKIAADIAAADSIVVISHFKGHEVAGFGGALKNLGMGCAASEGKREQHTALPFVKKDDCITCGACINACPVFCISLSGPEIVIDLEHCIGCLMCMNTCPKHAIDIDWKDDGIVFVERMVEYAAGAVAGKPGKAFYISFLTNITPHCDCMPWNDIPIVLDIGILASRDPVALDKACYDLLNNADGIFGSLLSDHHHEGEGLFTQVLPGTQPELQISYAEEMGLGRSEYRIRDV
ncbi:MAG: DUF362 domain-containing protein [Methanocalculaceae archaeon]|jgi:uncharacterized Fe-S center protein|nr:DUF362 domain-containing protein [Methanocalculaceae archaeon]